jgi:ribonuclease HI
MAQKKNKYYVVWQGKRVGIFDSWEACERQVNGVVGAKFKSFATRQEAEKAFKQPWEMHYAIATTPKKKSLNSDTSISKAAKPILESIAVDAACSGNPGVMEYQGVDTTTAKQLFHQKFALGTNNIGEFLAIVHALAYLKQKNDLKPIYSDSKTAIGWVKNKKVGTKLVRNAKTQYLYELIDRAINWLETNTYTNKILKWETEDWGEIPADFGRK